MQPNKPHSILVVDDEPEIREGLVEFFRGEGFDTKEASNAADALALVLEGEIDFVLSDISMPRDSGLDLLESIRKYRPGVQVLFMSGAPNRKHSKALAKHAVRVIEKPFAMEKVLAMVLDVWKNPTALPKGGEATPVPEDKPLILVVDDSKPDRRVIEEAFRKMHLNAAIEFRSHAEEAEAYLKDLLDSGKPLPKLILLDINMPRKGGKSWLGELKQHPLFHSIPIVMLTSSSSPSDLSECYELGANSYFTKPSELSEFIAVLTDVFRCWLKSASPPAVPK